MVGIKEMKLDGPLPPRMNDGMVGTMVDEVGPPLVGSRPTTVCAVKKGPLGPGFVSQVEGIPRMMGQMDTTPRSTIPPERG